MRSWCSCAILVLACLGGCASFSPKTSGTSGPIVWHWTDGQTSIDRDQYSAVLVLLETMGRALVFTKVTTSVSGAGPSMTTTSEGSWTLPAYGELRLPMGARVMCFASNCRRAIPPLWDIVLTGRDDMGRPVSVTIAVILPMQ